VLSKFLRRNSVPATSALYSDPDSTKSPTTSNTFLPASLALSPNSTIPCPISDKCPLNVTLFSPASSKLSPRSSTSSLASFAPFSNSSKAEDVWLIWASMLFISASVLEMVVFIVVKLLLALITLFLLVSKALVAFDNSSSNFLTSSLFSP